MNSTILKITLEELKHSVQIMLSDRNEEINKLIIEELDKQLTEEWIIDSIRAEVRSALKRAVEGIADNYRVVNSIRDIMGEQIANKLGENK